MFFKDIDEGWVLLATDENQGPEAAFEVASTTNSGGSWTIIPVDVPATGLPNRAPLPGGGVIFFLDSMHGWLNLNLEGSQNFSPAIPLATEDGGKTWIRKDSPGDGTLRFTTADNGWLAGGPGREYLYTTRDGGTSWQEASLMNPPEVNGSSGGRYSAPFFSDQQHGFVSMTRSSSGGKILFATDDGGESWRAYRTTSDDFDDSAASALADSVWFVAKSDQSSITLIRVQLGLSATVETRTAAVQVSAFPTAIRDISFATSEQGWIFTDRLYSTSDGGQSWKDATPWPIPKMETVPSTGPQASAQTLSTDLGNVRTIVQTRAPGGIQ